MEGANKPLPIKVFNNRTYLSISQEGRKVLPSTLLITAVSGAGKGLTLEYYIEEWKKLTGGICIILSDPKNENESFYVQFLPIAQYHLNRLMLDGMRPETHKCKVYHPYTNNIPKAHLPNIDFFTLSLKDLGKEEWGILAETPFESSTIKLLQRVARNMSRNDGLFKLIHMAEKLTEVKTGKSKKNYDPDSFYIRSRGASAKSITELVELLDPFKQNYFLRKDSCPHKLDWEKILTDTESYHIFISMWLKSEKLQEFVVLSLLQQVIENRHFAKKPILLVLPEIKRLCPRNAMGYKYFLSLAIADNLITMRSQGKGISAVMDTQIHCETSEKITGSVNTTLFGQLSPFDADRVSKMGNYKRDIREQLQNMPANSYLKYGNESDGAWRLFFPRHRHCEPEYNWIETYNNEWSKLGLPRPKRYDDLKKEMKAELKAEEQEIKEIIDKEIQKERKEKERKKSEKESKESSSENKSEKIDKEKNKMKKLCYEMYYDENLSKSEKSYRKIGEKFELHNMTVKKYIQEYEDENYRKSSTDEIEKEDINNMIGSGVLQEEIDENYSEEIPRED